MAEKYNIEFHDQNMNKVVVDIEVREINVTHRNKYTLEEYTATRDISFSGEVENSRGQIMIDPRTESQRRLADFWKRYHLSGMSAGTVSQDAYLHSEQYKKDCARFTSAKDIVKEFPFIHTCPPPIASRAFGWVEDFTKRGVPLYQKTFRLTSYETECFLLAANDLYIDRGYAYGSGWLHEPITDEVIEELEDILADIEDEEDELHETIAQGIDFSDSSLVITEEIVEQVMDRGYDRDDACKFIAVALHEGISEAECDNSIEIDGHNVSIYGRTYCVGELDEMDSYARDYMDSDYEWERMWRDSVASGGTTDGMRDWFDEIIRYDGWESVLCHYDGHSYEYRIAGNTYVLGRQ